MSTELLMKLSCIIDKMDIAKELAAIEVTNNDEVAKNLFVIVITKMYKVQDEIYKFISEYKNISVEEAKKADVLELIKELSSIEGLKNFFPIA